MNPMVAEAMADLADLAYDVYAETLDDLRTVRVVGMDLIETVNRLSESTGGFEAEALSVALSDYLACVPQRSRDHFRDFLTNPDARCG